MLPATLLDFECDFKQTFLTFSYFLFLVDLRKFLVVMIALFFFSWLEKSVLLGVFYLSITLALEFVLLEATVPFEFDLNCKYMFLIVSLYRSDLLLERGFLYFVCFSDFKGFNSRKGVCFKLCTNLIV